jgi:two-component system sensor histidine kinase RstB
MRVSKAPLEVRSRTTVDLPPQLLEKLDRGEVIPGEGHFLRSVLYVRIGTTDRVLRFGPLHPTHPLGGARGIGILLLGFCGLSVGVYLLVRPLSRRLGELSRAAYAFGSGDLTARAIVDSPDSIGTVASAFNRMAQEIQRLIASQRELLRMVSHELRTPLQRMHFTLERIRKAEETEQRGEELRRMERDLGELDSLIDELLTYVRLQHDAPLQRQTVDLQRLIDEVVATQAELTDEVSLHHSTSLSELPAVQSNERMLRRALDNLVANGLRSARSRVEVSVTRSRTQLCIAIDDDGPGVPTADRELIFEPFARLDNGQQRGQTGCGLGLAIVRRIAERHQGTIAVDESRLGGARFRLTLPLAP